VSGGLSPQILDDVRHPSAVRLALASTLSLDQVERFQFPEPPSDRSDVHSHVVSEPLLPLDSEAILIRVRQDQCVERLQVRLDRRVAQNVTVNLSEWSL